ncbi:DUF1499 domain-containing protein [Tumidithrix elongata RA019]|uniref:DUF1499 domain-containing protein n=1 Tax=Tumidithrix elongata BACA0141 TaxID=2716417 RepID=A0AAW9Q028_9CYAN|nr:DUF1499 domain-containing protein [Tumidithrix elongata RA019]
MHKLLRTLIGILMIAMAWIGLATPVMAGPLSPHKVTPMALFSFSGTRPTNLGVQAGKLSPCPNSPNCVSSQSSDLEHKIDPIRYTGDPAKAIANLKTVIQGLERTKIISETEDYLYAEFTSALMGYVDDVEFYLNRETNVIEVRSASRLGQSDLGVNRKRVEAIRTRLQDFA